MYARLSFGVLLALGLADLAVLDLHLAPQLSPQDVPVVVEPKVLDGGVPATTPSAPVAVVPAVGSLASASPLGSVPPVGSLASASPASPLGSAPPASSAVAVKPPPTSTPGPSGHAMSDILFFTDDDRVLSQVAITELDRIARELASDPSKRVLLRGHSDMIGEPEHKQALSVKRAMSVQRFLVAHGAPTGQISVEGVSDGDPAVPGKTPAALAMNRRVQVLWR